MMGVVFLFPLFSAVFAQEQCLRYACYNDSLSQLPPHACTIFSDKNQTFYVKPCASYENLNLTYCPPLSEPGNSSCIALGPSNAYSAYPGEPCTGDLTCIEGNYCGSSGICMANSTAEACSDPTDCNMGLTCLGGKCELQKPLGAACSSDWDCVNSAGCDGTNCTSYFSLQEGEAVSSCAPPAYDLKSIYNFNLSSFCESNICYENRCLRSLNLSTSENPVDCTDHDYMFCNSSYYSQDGDLEYLLFHTDCVCGYNPTGRAYCALFPGDPPALRYFQKLKQWINSDEVNSCHTARRWALPCIGLYWSQKDFAELQYYFYSYQSFPYVQGIDSCVSSVFLSDYVAAERLYKDFATVLGSLSALLIASLA